MAKWKGSSAKRNVKYWLSFQITEKNKAKKQAKHQKQLTKKRNKLLLKQS